MKSPIPLKLANLNNKLSCNGFLVINRPPKDPVKTSDLQQVYEVRVNNSCFLVQVVEVIIVKFLEIGDWYTIPANGMREGEWKRSWLANNPDTKDETELAIYFYLKI